MAEQIHSETFKYKLIATHSNKSETENEESYLNLGADFGSTSTADLKDVNKFLSKVEDSAKSNGYTLNSYNSGRIADSIEPSLLKIYHSLVLLLKGSPLVLYGDEIALDKQNPRMKWESSGNCGFSPNKTSTLKSNCQVSVKASLAHGSGETLLKIYQELIKLRKEPSINWGKVYVNKNVTDSNVISYLRQADGFDGYLIVANVANSQPEFVDLVQRHQLRSDVAQVVFFHSNSPTNHDDFKENNTVSASHIMLNPYQLLILKI